MKFNKTILALLLVTSVMFFGCAPKDADIQANVEKKINSMPDVTGVSVVVNDGVATLSGEVKEAAAKDKATESAKDVKGVKSVVNNCTVAPLPAPPVLVNTDSALMQGVTDATKDFPTVTAAVSNGEITLTGSIDRSRLQTLMQSLNTLNPKKINNQLTIK